MHNDVMLLKQVAIDELVANTDQWADLPDISHTDSPEAGHESAMRRLEELGLITTEWGGATARDGVSLTRAGVEALAYLVRCS